MLTEIITAITTGLSQFGTAIVDFIGDAMGLFYDTEGLTILGILGLVFISLGFVTYAINFIRSFFNK